MRREARQPPGCPSRHHALGRRQPQGSVRHEPQGGSQICCHAMMMMYRADHPGGAPDDRRTGANVSLPVASPRRATLAAFVSSGMLAVVWVARMPAIRDSLGLSPSEIGLVLLATALGSIASIAFVGRLAVAFGSDAVLRRSLPLMALSAVVLGFSTTYPMLLASAAVTGAFLGMTDVTMNSQASLIERRSGVRVLAGMHAGWSFGSAMGAGLAALTAALGAGVSTTMMIAALLVGMVWALTQGAYIHDGTQPDQAGERRVGRIRLPQAIFVIGMIMTLAFLIEGAVAGWSTLYLHDQFGVAAWLAAVGYLTYELAMVTGRLVGDRARRRWGDRRSAVVGSLLASVGLALVLVAPASSLAVLGLIVVGLGQSVVVPIAFAAAGVLAPDVAAAAIARVGGFGYAGMLAGPAAFGVVAQATSMRAGFLALLALAVFLVFAVRRGVKTPDELARA
ncbi:MAG TPA: MFS transporter [Rhodoglobus sp.]|nr:MFS transporter [Rhodoglobus sp.]